MKTIFVGDLHLGEGKDSSYIQNIQLDFFKQMAEYASSHGITTLRQSGDWFDVRSGVTAETQMFMREKIRPILETVFDEVHVIVGNHDMHMRHQIMPNSVNEYFVHDPLFRVYNEPTTITIGSTMWDMIPWECKENKEQIREFIKNSSSEYSLGHWELMGFDFYTGVPAIGGDNSDFLSQYKVAVSGHYHTASRKGNVLYIGTPYTITMNDVNDLRGFYVFDSDTEEFEFIPNRNMWHVKVNYSDIDNKNLDLYADKCVQLIIEKSDKNLESVLSKLEEICERVVQKNLEDFGGISSDGGEDVEIKKVVQLIKDHIDTLDIDEIHRVRTLQLANSLYVEAKAS